ncbi:MAG: hypothetical protein CL675_03895 [Bdellovibrionaceae bacterium]|nr:hypothetical protein [Pseudobdellovibrionaceae bacterium]
MRFFYFLIPISFVGLVYVLSFGFYGVPPLGSALNPSHGVWQNSTERLEDSEVSLGAKSEGQVIWDPHRIPHIFANSERDLFYIQGYIHAMHRLFQMDVQSRVAEARVSELVGPKGLKMDRFFLKMGGRQINTRGIERILGTDEYAAMQAYSDGVNAYIDQLTEKTKPTEYKFFGVFPEKWSPRRTISVHTMMSFRLSGKSFDLYHTELAQRLGLDEVKYLYPYFPKDFVPVAPGFRLDADVPRYNDKGFVSSFKMKDEWLEPFSGAGSNNWAVGPSRSKSGKTIISNDTHLRYLLPALWYEMQLKSPSIDVYGAGFPGAPGLMIGFNQFFGWAVTNAHVDIVDWFELKTKGQTYLVDGEWKDFRVHPEVIRVRGASDESFQLLESDFGFVLDEAKDKALAVRWLLHDGVNGFGAFYHLNRSKTFSECQSAIAGYIAPGMNFICGDADNISIKHQAKVPRREWGQGRFVLDGTDSKNNWKDYLLASELPHIENPASGYVLSANQHPADEKYPYSLQWGYSPSFRAGRIQEILAAKKDHTPEDFVNYHSDNKNGEARLWLPGLLSSMESKITEEAHRSLFERLKKWDYFVTAESIEGAFFYFWRKNIFSALWDDELGGPEKRQVRRYPKRRTLELLSGATVEPRLAKYIDDVSTEQREDLGDIGYASFVSTFEQMARKFGREVSNWGLDRTRPTQIPHMGKVPGLGSKPFPMGGSWASVNANWSDRGATWRMVVEFTDPVTAYTQYPGGQVGNPMDRDYEAFVSDWSKGKARRSLYMTGGEKLAGDFHFWKVNP